MTSSPEPEILASSDATDRDAPAATAPLLGTPQGEGLPIATIRFCAIECRLQQSGEVSVWWMANAWVHAQQIALPLSVDDVLVLGALVEPDKNADGFRQVGVRVGEDVKGDWRNVPRQMVNLVEASERLTAAEWFREYEEVHPFRDGNGRTGQILYNLLSGTLDAPEWAPDYWGDWRRQAGAGLPSRGLSHFPEGAVAKRNPAGASSPSREEVGQ